MFKIIFFVPLEDAEKVKQALFATGAGKIGQYDCCSWETKGTGQFRPLKGSSPYIGSSDQLEKVEELRVELVCETSLIKEAVAALKKAHPYETPAYQVIKVEQF